MQPNSERRNEHDTRDLNPQEIIERIEKLYTNLEYVAINEAQHFSMPGKMNLRKAQAEVQRIRLLLYDLTGLNPLKSGDK